MPISEAIRATKSKIIDCLNGSGLPIDVMDMIIAELSRKIHEQAEREFKELIESREMQEAETDKANTPEEDDGKEG